MKPVFLDTVGLIAVWDDSDQWHDLAMPVFAQVGDLPAARSVLRAAPNDVEPTALVAYVANYWDLHWVLDGAEQALLLRLTPS